MTKDIYVQARADHVASLASASPLAAIEELIWNALDADAREVRVDLVTNALGGIDAVRVSDDGTGIDILRADETFGSLGGSWKRSDGATTAVRHRRLHGRHGRGRFKTFALGSHVEWRTTMRAGGDLLSYTLSGDSTEPGVFHVVPASGTGPATGTEVLVTGVHANVESLSDAAAAVQALAAKFAIYLKAYPDVAVYYCGLPVSPVIVQRHTTDYPIDLGGGQTAKLEVIEWRRRFPGTGRLVFCGRDGFALHDRPAGVRPGWTYSFTAYIVSPRFGELAAENALVMDELHPEVRAYIDAARRILRDHFRARSMEDAAQRISKWIAEKSYPFAADDVSPERKAFDDGVTDMRSHLDGFDSLPASERTYLFALLRKSLASH